MYRISNFLLNILTVLPAPLLRWKGARHSISVSRISVSLKWPSCHDLAPAETWGPVLHSPFALLPFLLRVCVLCTTLFVLPYLQVALLLMLLVLELHRWQRGWLGRRRRGEPLV